MGEREEQITDTELVRRWLAALVPTNPRVRYTRSWALVKYFHIDYTAAAIVCERHGFNPDDRVRDPG